MKIYDIISEATPGAGPQYSAGAAARRAAANAPSTTAPAASAPSMPKDVTKIAGKSGLAKTGGVWNKWDRFQKAIDINKARKATRVAASVGKWKVRLGPWFTVLRILGVATAATELVTNVYTAEEMFADGELTSEKQLRDYRQFLWGVFLAQILIPNIVRYQRVVVVITWLARFLVTAITGAGTIITSPTGAGAAAGVSALVAEQVFFTALQAWLQMPSTVQWMADHIFQPLIWIGTIPENTWNLLAKEVTGSDAYDDALEKRKTTPKKEPKSNDDVQKTEPAELPYNPATGTLMPQRSKTTPSNPADTSLQNQELY